MLSVGDTAPAFTLLDTEGNPFSFEETSGTRLVVFIPFPFTGICDDEGCALRDNLAELNDLDTQVIVITVHAKPVIKKWSDENGFSFPVLSDYWPHGETAKAYGAFNEKTGGANRNSYLIDGDGVVREIFATGSLKIPREYDGYVEALDRL